MPTLNWLNRNEALTVASKVPYRLLEAVPEYDYGDPAATNMLIQGDNLDALKSLLHKLRRALSSPQLVRAQNLAWVADRFRWKQITPLYDAQFEVPGQSGSQRVI